jgi:hypothetical protein
MATPYDMANMTVTGTPGTGTITLNAAVSGYQTFAAAGVPNGATVSYGISDAAGAWEVGRGVYTSSGTSLTRGPIYSSNSNAAISATSAATVRVTLLAEDLSGLSTSTFVLAVAALSTAPDLGAM